MSKLKTRKSIAKRFELKKNGKKIIMRACGQDHFNSRERGKITRAKRRDKSISGANYKVIATNING